ncbi:S9 family peptidase [Corynebacterium timonense]|uniref:Oligopeptidase B Serine peptidase. MEROPS family S09A n=1 Tax=Corynebacterium timonense TaxID=441500 RepID=A0A1H1L9H6_9CORY|nr:S9 family peptidase [Corynebacterium timonense]SDR71077.1 oligopeptidase B Serine peptidase. MEROPS family S09A [Corynebacterium timonense]
MTDNPTTSTSTSGVPAPVATKHPITRSFHGRDFVDNYEWLRDKDNPETIAYLEAENAYTQARTEGLDELTEAVYGEIKSRIKETDMTVPQRRGGWWYYARTVEGKSYGLSCRVAADPASPWTPPTLPEDGSALPGEQVVLDVNELAEGHEFFSLGASTVTTSGRLLAYSADTSGDERFQLRVKDLQTGELLADTLDDVFYGATWAGEEYLFYTRVDEAWRPHQVWRHRLGTPAELDVLVYEEPDERFNVSVGIDRAEKYLYIASSSKLTSEWRVCPLAEPEGEFEVLWPREQGVEYDVDYAEVAGEPLWVVTHNAAGPNFEVGTCGVDKRVPLTELEVRVPHDDAVRIEGVDVYRDFWFCGYRSGGISRLAVAEVGESGVAAFRELEFDEELYTAGLGGNPEWDAPVVRLSYASYTQPAQLFDYTVATRELRLLKQQEVLGGYDPHEYTATRMWASAPDGTQVPMSVVHRADLDLSQPRPTLLYGYGSYEASNDPGFSIARLSLLDRGMVWVCAHVRGGGEMGRGWYDHGKGLEKVNTFTDFIACADALVEQGITTHGQLVAEGGSAGGLLMGAVANMAPEKFAGIQAIVPFVDPLTSVLMPELPLTVTEWEEWGDPYHDPEVYDYMAAYAPYENVEAKHYPDILAVTSLNDTRVLYVEPAKWVAKLRECATGGEILLKTEMSAGHGGVSGRYEKWRQTAFEYAWTLVHSGAVSK